MTVTLKQLQDMLPNAGPQAGVFLPVLNSAMVKWDIVTPVRKRTFLAQVGHESGQLRDVRELGTNTYLAEYNTGTLGKRLCNTPRADGDGQKYRGRGLIQVSSRDNYRAAGQTLGLPLLEQSELLEHPEWTAMSAAWFWSRANPNELAGQLEAITRKINGGLNGHAELLELYDRALQVLE